MAYRNILVENNAQLSLKLSQLRVKNDEKEISIPVEDLESIVISNPKTSITTKLISKLAENNVALFICDDKHLPIGVLHSFQNHTRQNKRIFMQIELTEPFKKRLWQKIVVMKVRNQARVLEILELSEKSTELIRLSNLVQSGDVTNIEGRAAALYFKSIFGKYFSRGNEFDISNSFLNYIYAIIRGSIARHLVAYGFIPAIGIHHKNEYNNFNLADDIIESFRPLADLYVLKTMNFQKDDMTTSDKSTLVDVLQMQVEMQGKKMSLNNACEAIVKGLVSCIEHKSIELFQMPTINLFTRKLYE